MDFEDLIKDPAKYGAPTYEEFCKDPEKFKGRPDEILSMVYNCNSKLRDRFDKWIFEINGYRFKTIEKIESVAKDMGVTISELKANISLIPQGGGKCDVLVQFVRDTQKTFD